MKITVCIPTFRRAESLAGLLGNLIAQADKFHELLIAVTGKYEDSLPNEKLFNQQIHALEMQGITVRTIDERAGLLDAKQWFKKNATHNLLLIIDDDASPGHNYFDLAKHFEDDRVGAVSGVLQTPINYRGYTAWDKEIRHVDKDITWANEMVFTEDFALDKSTTYQLYMLDEDRVFRCEYLIGTCLFIRKDLFEIDMYYDQGNASAVELDYTYNIHRQGYRVLFDSSAICWHLDAVYGGQAKKKSRTYEHHQYFIQKWELPYG